MYLADVFAGLAARLHEERSTNLFQEVFSVLSVYLPTALQIKFGSDKEDAYLFVSMFLDLPCPVLQRFEAAFRVDRVHQQNRAGPLVERPDHRSECLETRLSLRFEYGVPYLHLHGGVLYFSGLARKFHANGNVVVVPELALHIVVGQSGLADALLSNDDDLKRQVVLVHCVIMSTEDLNQAVALGEEGVSRYAKREFEEAKTKCVEACRRLQTLLPGACTMTTMQPSNDKK